MVKIIVFNLLLIAGTILSVFLTPVDPFEKEGGLYLDTIVPIIVTIATTVIVLTLRLSV